MKFYEIEQLLSQPRQAALAAFGEGRISRIVPVAWPLLRSEWNVIVSVSEPVGLVDRFILRALRDFGPCTIAELDEFLCLGEDRTTAAVEELLRIGAPIVKNDNGCYCVNGAIPIEDFQIKREHRFEFLLNGLSGDLLPSDMLGRMKRIIFSKEDFEEKPWIQRLNPILSSQESKALRELDPAKALQASDANGIPYGFQKLVGEAPLNESIVFALGFVFVDLSGKTLLLAATEAAEEITVPEKLLRDNTSIPMEPVPLDESFANGFDTTLVKISRPQSKPCSLQIAVLDDAFWSLPADNKDKKLEQTRRLAERLLRGGWYWHRFAGPMQYGCFNLYPGNEKTERAILIRKAVGMLSEQSEDIKDLSSYSEWMANFLMANDASEAIMEHPFSLDEILSIAHERREGNIIALQDRLDKAKATEKVNPQASSMRAFLDSTNKDFGRRIVDLIREARQSVCIVSPVIQDDEVFTALRESFDRGVAIRVVTQLGNHRSGQFETSPEFNDYDIPRQRLAELGACVRDWDVTVHAKMLLVDREKFLFSTANLNENSLGTGTRNAVEAAILFECSPEVNAGCVVFDAIWEGAATRQVKRDDHIAIVRMPQQVRVPEATGCMLRAGPTEILLSTPSNHFLANRIASLFRGASKNVLMATMSIYDLEKVPVLFKSICEALSRGVTVTVLARTGSEQFKLEDWPDPSTKKLMDYGLKILEVPRLHAKGVFVDCKVGMMMSANLNPYSLGDLETSHVEIATQAPCTAPFMAAFQQFALSLLKRAGNSN